MWDVFLILIGVVIGALVKPFQDSLYTPKLKFDFKNDDPRFIFETIDSNLHKYGYLRVGIRNDGWATAKNVRILVTRLVVQTSAGARVPFNAEVLDLRFANIHEPMADIPRNSYRMVDVCRVQHRLNLELQFLFLSMPPYFPRDLAAGTYEMTLQATAENCKPTSANVKFVWRGTTFAFA
jgi:hypothetical protein